MSYAYLFKYIIIGDTGNSALLEFKFDCEINEIFSFFF